MEQQNVLIGLIILSFCCSLVGLFFDKSDFKNGLKMMIGGFFFGSVIAYVIYDNDIAVGVKRIIVLVSAMFAKPLYNKVRDRIGYWLDKFITNKAGGEDKRDETIPILPINKPSDKNEQ